VIADWPGISAKVDQCGRDRVRGIQQAPNMGYASLCASHLGCREAVVVRRPSFYSSLLLNICLLFVSIVLLDTYAVRTYISNKSYAETTLDAPIRYLSTEKPQLVTLSLSCLRFFSRYHLGCTYSAIFSTQSCLHYLRVLPHSFFHSFLFCNASPSPFRTLDAPSAYHTLAFWLGPGTAS
jgi:hypothetical protein